MTVLLLFLLGLAALVAGSDLLVRGASKLAISWGISPLVVGLTVVAFGTSSPEMAVSVQGALSGSTDIAIGNVVGSNTFNILGVLGLSGLVSDGGLGVATSVLRFDLPAMVAVAIACLPVFFSNRRIGRWEGLMFLGYYVAYVGWLILDARGHDALEGYRTVMLYVVIPLTVVTIAVVTGRGARPPAGTAR
jgi:cation:H+ antiporter